MERIDFPGGFFLVPQKPVEKKETKRLKTRRFLSFLSKETEEGESLGVISTEFLSKEELYSQLEKTLDQVHQLGERLKNDPTLSGVMEYKDAVRAFLRLVVKGCYRIDEKTSSQGILNRKKYTQIRVIDEKLERLAAEVMQGQREQLDILKRVDEIYGALVDLLQ
ncbi:MAG: YaaR family protein [Spirochaetes bacterium]|nr:YaaR family protein [Spirochaetota bacterium]